MSDRMVSQILKEVYQAFQQADFQKARELADEAHSLDFEDNDVLSALKCSVFWKEKFQKTEAGEAPAVKGDALIREFQGFLQRFSGRLDSPFEEGLFHLKAGVVGRALDYYRTAQQEAGGSDPVLMLKAGKAQKLLGDYQKAQETLEQALGLHRDNPEVLAQLADCLEMTGETRGAKVLFREAFYIDPQKIDLEALQSDMIRKVVSHLSPRNFPRPQLVEWIPVYAELYGLFSVKRELRPIELGQLKQGIYALRNEMAEKKSQKDLLLPRLINRYFWLIDHYVCVKEERSRIEEVLLNIKVLDPSIYSQYIN